MTRTRPRALFVLAALLTVTGSALASARIVHHAGAERATNGEPHTLEALTAAPRDLVVAPLDVGQEVVFELCAADGFPEARWRDRARFSVWHRDAGEQVLEAPLDAARLAAARRGEGLGCVVLASASSLAVGGRYAIALAPGSADDAPRDVPLVARMVASRPMASIDLGALLALVLASLAFVGVLARGSLAPSADGASGTVAAPRPELRAAIAFGLLFVALFAVGLLPVHGPMAAVAGAALLAAVQVGCALGLAAPGDPAARRAVLGLGLATKGSRVALAAAPLVGVGLVVAGRFLSTFVPSTGEAPIETFVASRSGYLAVAASGVLLPVVEELFFRGLLYGLLARAYGANAATALVIVAFPLLHLPQVVGAWGALVSLAATGAAMTLLRRASGSVAPSAAAHLVHNTLVALLGFPL